MTAKSIQKQISDISLRLRGSLSDGLYLSEWETGYEAGIREALGHIESLQVEEAPTTNTYTLFWRTGQRQLVQGTDPVDAMNNAGIGGGALPALDFWSQGDDQEWIWNKENKNWERKDEDNDL